MANLKSPPSTSYILSIWQTITDSRMQLGGNLTEMHLSGFK